MKLNKKENEAINSLINVLVAILNSTPIDLDYKNYNAIKDLLGIDLKQATLPKKEIETFFKGKEDFHIEFSKPFSAWSKQNKVKRHGYFPFQIKERKALPKSTKAID